jgi:hypothetical protein
MLEKQGSLRMILPVLPTYYYLDHFTEMMSFVEETYGAALGPEHYGFMEQFRGLAMDEQCLCVRMLNRGGLQRYRAERISSGCKAMRRNLTRRVCGESPDRAGSVVRDRDQISLRI